MIRKDSSPVIIVNFKVYSEVEGKKALSLAKTCQEISDETGVSIIACPPMTELSVLSADLHIPIFSQHIDSKRPGSSTGWVTPEMIKACGAQGSLLNHSEHKLVLADIQSSVAAMKALGLRTVVCADTPETSASVAVLGPEFVAVEPPELIGGDISVTDAKPEVVENAVRAVQRIDSSVRVLCGAGVKNGKDVKKAVDLGASGVLLASGVVKAKDPRAVLMDLVQYL